jgi:hypothetical protein
VSGPVPLQNRDLARLALSKAKEHLELAEGLRATGSVAFGYGHLVFALEEAGKGAVRLLVDLGVIHWGDDFGGIRLEERGLSDRGSHKFKTYVGGSLALAGAVREFVDKDDLLAALKERGVTDLKEAAAVSAEKLLPILPKLLTPDFEGILSSAQSKREAAFYSGPKKPGDPLPDAVSIKDYEELALPVRSAVEGVAFLDRPGDPKVVEFVAAFVEKVMPNPTSRKPPSDMKFQSREKGTSSGIS